VARIRSIKPEFWSHERLAQCSRDARLLFIGLWNHCDDLGRARAHPALIKGQVFPYDQIDVVPLLEELERGEFIRRYEHDGQMYLEVPSWDRHQVINKPSKTTALPAPAAAAKTTRKRATAPLPEPSGSTTPRKGREGKGEEGKGEGGEPPAPPLPETDFSRFVREHWPDVKEPERREQDWKQACPAVDLLAESRKAWSWEQESPQNRKVDHASFLGRWFRKCQDQPRATSPPLPLRNGAYVPAREPETPRIPGRKIV
jgi:hypothetical protein